MQSESRRSGDGNNDIPVILAADVGVVTTMLFCLIIRAHRRWAVKFRLQPHSLRTTQLARFSVVSAIIERYVVVSLFGTIDSGSR